MWQYRNIDIRITREMWEALYAWLAGKYSLVHAQLQQREAETDTYDLVLHDFCLAKITPAQIQSWSHRAYARMYNFKQSFSVALILHERLAEEGYNERRQLEKFHLQLYQSLCRVFSDKKLNPGEWEKIEHFN